MAVVSVVCVTVCSGAAADPLAGMQDTGPVCAHYHQDGRGRSRGQGRVLAFQPIRLFLNESRDVGMQSDWLDVVVQMGGFYRGMAFPLLSVGFLNSFFFGIYGNSLRLFGKPETGNDGKGSGDYPYSAVLLAGAVAGGLQAIPASPIELIKIRLQSSTGIYQSFNQIVSSIVQSHVVLIVVVVVVAQQTSRWWTDACCRSHQQQPQQRPVSNQ